MLSLFLPVAPLQSQPSLVNTLLNEVWPIWRVSNSVDVFYAQSTITVISATLLATCGQQVCFDKRWITVIRCNFPSHHRHTLTVDRHTLATVTVSTAARSQWRNTGKRRRPGNESIAERGRRGGWGGVGGWGLLLQSKMSRSTQKDTLIGKPSHSSGARHAVDPGLCGQVSKSSMGGWHTLRAGFLDCGHCKNRLVGRGQGAPTHHPSFPLPLIFSPSLTLKLCSSSIHAERLGALRMSDQDTTSRKLVVPGWVSGGRRGGECKAEGKWSLFLYRVYTVRSCHWIKRWRGR